RERYFINFLYCRGEVRMDDDAIHVANDEQGRVFKRLAVLQKLIISGVEVLMLPLVLPSEVSALPHISPALAAAVLVRAALESEPFAQRVNVRRLRVFKDLA